MKDLPCVFRIPVQSPHDAWSFFPEEAGKYPKMKKTSLGMSEMVYLNICQKWYHGLSMENDDDASTF